MQHRKCLPSVFLCCRNISTTCSLKLAKLARVTQTLTSVKEVSNTPLLSAGIVSVKFSISTDDTREPGPENLSDLGKTSPVGEAVGLQTLLNSLNTGTVCGGESGGLLRVSIRRGKKAQLA